MCHPLSRIRSTPEAFACPMCSLSRCWRLFQTIHANRHRNPFCPPNKWTHPDFSDSHGTPRARGSHPPLHFHPPPLHFHLQTAFRTHSSQTLLSALLPSTPRPNTPQKLVLFGTTVLATSSSTPFSLLSGDEVRPIRKRQQLLFDGKGAGECLWSFRGVGFLLLSRVVSSCFFERGDERGQTWAPLFHA